MLVRLRASCLWCQCVFEQEHMSQLEKDVADEKRGHKSTQSELDNCKRNLELINFCRPIIRNHAFAFCMAAKAGINNATSTTTTTVTIAPISPNGGRGIANESDTNGREGRAITQGDVVTKYTTGSSDTDSKASTKQAAVALVVSLDWPSCVYYLISCAWMCL
jgi:hypothetical protein